MPADRGRCYVAAVGIEHYAAGTDWGHLDQVPKELGQIIGVLTGDLGLEQASLLDPGDLTGDGVRRSLDAWTGKRGPGDRLILYWTGHGEVVPGQGLYLILPGTRNAPIDGLPLTDLVFSLLPEDSRLSSVLLLLDVCFAEAGAQDVASVIKGLTNRRPTATQPSVAIVSSVRFWQEAQQGRFAGDFAKAVRDALASAPDAPDKPYLNILDVFETRIRGELTGVDTGRLLIYGAADQLQFFPNPYHNPRWPDGIKPSSREGQMFKRLDAAARAASEREPGAWRFEGRRQVFADLGSWLAEDPGPGLWLVRGEMGSGKTSVLARLYTLSQSDYREHVPPEVLESTALPPVGAIDDRAFLLPLLSWTEVNRKIGDILGISANSDAALKREIRHLLESSADAQNSGRLDSFATLPLVTIVADGLDEAEARDKTFDLFQLLARRHARIIIGMRSSCPIPDAAFDRVIDLDTEPWRDEEAVVNAIAHILCKANQEWAQDPDSLNARAHAIVKHTTGNFQFATLWATTLANGTDCDPLAPGATFPHSIDEFFDQLFHRLREDEADARALLLPLAYAEGDGLSAGALWPSLANHLGQRDDLVAQVADKIRRKVYWALTETGTSSEPMFRLFHAALREYLCDDRNTRDSHGVFTEVLDCRLSQVVDDGSNRDADTEYARTNLARHLRLAGRWQGLQERVMDPAWIALRCESGELDSPGYDADVVEARIAADEANLAAIRTHSPAPSLAPMVWFLIWRSTLVGLVERIPPAALALVVKIGALSPPLALRLVAGIGDETKRAARLAALAEVVRGRVLESLLDHGKHPARLLSVSRSDQDTSPSHKADDREQSEVPAPIAGYADILIGALQGEGAADIASVVLAELPLFENYWRYRLVRALLPLLQGPVQMDNLREHVKRMPDDTLGETWRSRALAAYLVERIRRGDGSAMDEVAALPDTDITRALAIAALHQAGLTTPDPTPCAMLLARELSTPADLGSRLVTQMDVATELIGGMDSFDCAGAREALARYLSLLRVLDYENYRIGWAAKAGECLPEPHGSRLLRWAKSRMLLYHNHRYRTDQINRFHTPSKLARAFAAKGLVEQAFEVCDHTTGSDYWRPSAYSALVRVLAENPSDTSSLGAILSEYATRAARRGSTFDAVQVSALGYDWLDADRRRALEDTIGQLGRPSLKTALDETRCRLVADWPVGTAPDEVAARSTLLFRLIDSRYRTDADEEASSRYSVDDLLTRYACRCAAAGHARAALKAIDTIKGWHNDDYALNQALEQASGEALPELIEALVARHSGVWNLRYAGHDALSALVGVVPRASLPTVRWLHDALPSSEASDFAPFLDGLRASLAARAFEFKDRALAEALLAQCTWPKTALDVCSGLPLPTRCAFVELLRSVHRDRFDSPGAGVECRYANLLCARDEPSSMSCSQALAKALAEHLESGDLIATFKRPLGLLRPADREAVMTRVLSTMDDEAISWGLAHGVLDGEALGWLGETEIDRCIEVVERLENDYDRDHGLLDLLPHILRLHGVDAARALWAKRGRRFDTRPSFWAALLPYLDPDERRRAFAELLPAEVYHSDGGDESLAAAAGNLTADELVEATRWIIHNFPKGQHGMVALKAAATRSGLEASYDVWNALVDEASRLPFDQAMGHLRTALPLLATLGGANALEEIERTLVRAAEQWP